MPGTKVLVVDAESRVREWAVAHLEAAGFKVATAKGPVEALRAVRQEPPDLVLVDHDLPGGGERLVGQLRRIPGQRDLPVAILSVHAEMIQRTRALRAGANFFLDKAIEPSEMVRRVRRIMGDRVERAELRVLPRLTLTLPCVASRLRGKGARTVRGQVQDLSGAGIAFTSPDDFERGEQVRLQFSPRDGKPIRAFLEVVWRRIQGEGFLIGCKYMARYPGDMEDVARYVARKRG